MREMGSSYGILILKPKEKKLRGRPVDGKIIFRWILRN
jgi:hypothetical protein